MAAERRQRPASLRASLDRGASNFRLRSSFVTTYANMLVETHGRVGLVRLNRPQARRAARAAAVPRVVRHRGPEGRHARLRREAAGGVQEPLKRAASRRRDRFPACACLPPKRLLCGGPTLAFMSGLISRSSFIPKGRP